ncbi:MAG: GNAT family N-acetyltransferase [Leptothrix sp. (in: b-proteobacteria)]
MKQSNASDSSPAGSPAASPAARPARRSRGLHRWVPIRPLTARHRTRILRHLLSLDARDRYLRFGYPASDAGIVHHVEMLDFSRNDLFGLFDRHLELLALYQLAYAPEPTAGIAPAHAGPETTAAALHPEPMAEFAVSVLGRARGRGYGGRLFAHAVRHARNRSIGRLMIHALNENTAMLHIARAAGAVVQREGSESEAWLQLPPCDLRSRLGEWLANRIAAIDHQWKRRMLHAWRLARPRTEPPVAGG